MLNRYELQGMINEFIYYKTFDKLKEAALEK